MLFVIIIVTVILPLVCNNIYHYFSEVLYYVFGVPLCRHNTNVRVVQNKCVA